MPETAETTPQALSAFQLPFPKVIRVEPAGACNLSCSHCPTGTIRMVRGMMRMETFDLILGAIRRNLDAIKVVVLYHGGEPLLSRHFIDMVKAVKGLRIPFVKTVSNGMLLPESTVDGLVTSGLDAIEFSLDGQSAEENDLVRRDCRYDVVIQNVKRLVDRRRALATDSPKIYISSTQFVDPQTYTRGQQAPLPEHVLRDFSGDYGESIEAYKCTFAMKWPHMEVDETVYGIFPDPYETGITPFCDHVESTMTIRWNGEVVPCCFDLTSQIVLGNVHDAPLESIWNNERYLSLRSTIDRGEFEPLCDACNVVKPNILLTLQHKRTAIR